MQFSPPRFLMCIPRFVPTRESLYDFLMECVFVCLTQHRSYAAPCRFLFTLQGRTARFVGVVGLPILFRGCFHTFLLRHRISSVVIAQSTRVHISCWQTYSIVSTGFSFSPVCDIILTEILVLRMRK